MNIYEKINAIRKAIGYIQKDKSVSTGGGSYKAVTHDAVTALVRSHMIEHGVICIPNLLESHIEPKEPEVKQFRYVAKYSFDFVNCEAPGEVVKIVLESHAMDNADKAPGKALSYAKKYAVLKLFELETGEDEESRYAPDEKTLSDEKFQFYKQSILSEMTKSAAKEIYQQAVKECSAVNDLASAKMLKEILIKHGEELDKKALKNDNPGQ